MDQIDLKCGGIGEIGVGIESCSRLTQIENRYGGEKIVKIGEEGLMGRVGKAYTDIDSKYTDIDRSRGYGEQME